MSSTKKSTSTSSKQAATSKKESKSRSSGSKRDSSENKLNSRLHKRSRSGKKKPCSLLFPFQLGCILLLILNAPDSVRLLHLPAAKEKMRRGSPILRSMHQLVCEMRV